MSTRVSESSDAGPNVTTPSSLSPDKQRMFLTVGVYLGVGLVLYAYLYSILVVLLVLTVAWYGLDLIRQHTAESVDATGKTVFITGCDTGFGLESAKTIRDAGFSVIAGCYNPDSPGAKELRARPWVKKVEVVSLDVTSEPSVQACAEEVKAICGDQGLWAVINNAGINTMGPVELVSMEMYHQCAEVNLFGAVRVTKSVLPLIRQAQGRIINVTSERAYNPWALSSPYCLAKAGLTTFSDCLRREMEEFKVKVITVAPGEFAGATAIVRENAVSDMEERLLKAQASLPLTDQQLVPYSRERILAIAKLIQAAVKRSGITSAPVCAAYLDAVQNAEPKHSYMVHGLKRACLDPRILIARCRPFLPECIVQTVEKVMFTLLD